MNASETIDTIEKIEQIASKQLNKSRAKHLNKTREKS